MSESWLKYTPTSGTASGSVTYTTDFFYGRKSRNTVSTISSLNITPVISRNVTIQQYGYGPYSPVNNNNILPGESVTVNVNRTTTSAQFNFDVNFKKIEIAQIDTVNFPLTLSFNSTNSWTGKVSGSGTWVNNNDIVGDPGSMQRYTTTLSCSFSQNTGASRGGKLRIRGYYNTSEHDVATIAGNDTYSEFYLIVQQAGVTEYYVTVGSLMPLDGEGDSTTWRLSLIQSNYDPTTLITGNFNIQRTDGEIDNCTVNGEINGDTEYLQVLTLSGDVYTRNPDLVSEEISNVNLSGVSQTSGYICTEVS